MANKQFAHNAQNVWQIFNGFAIISPASFGVADWPHARRAPTAKTHRQDF